MISLDLESDFGVQDGWQRSKSVSRESSRKALAVVQVSVMAAWTWVVVVEMREEPYRCPLLCSSPLPL